MKLRALFLDNVTEEQTIAKNVFWLFFGQILNRSLNFIAVAYAARFLGASAFGSLSIAFAFVTLCFMFSDLGVNLLVIREYGRTSTTERRGLLAALWYLKIACIAGSVLVAIVLFNFVHIPVSPRLFWLVLAALSIDLFRDFFTSIARALERATIESAVLMVDGALTAILGITFLTISGTIEGLVEGYVLAGLCASVLSVVLILRIGASLRARPEWAHLRELMRTIWPFAFAAIIAVSFVHVDIVLLGWLKGPEITGYYAPGSRIVQILFMLPMLLGAAILPALARSTARHAQAAIVQKALSFLLLLTIPLLVGGTLLAKPILTTLYGDAFFPGTPAFAVLLIMFFVYAITIVLDYLLLSLNLQNKNFQFTAIAAIANIVFALMLIPRWGILGAASASLLAQIVNILLTTRLAHTALRTGFIAWGDVSRYVLAAGVMGSVLYTLSLPLLLALPLGVLVYFVLLIVLRTPLLENAAMVLRA